MGPFSDKIGRAIAIIAGVFTIGAILIGCVLAWSALASKEYVSKALANEVQPQVKDHESRLRIVEGAVIEGRGHYKTLDTKLDTAIRLLKDRQR